MRASVASASGAFACLVLFVGCKAKPAPPDAAPVASVVDAGPPELPRVAGMHLSACLLYPSGAAWCAQPTGGGIAFQRIAEDVTETAHRRSCFLTKSGEAVCDGKRIGRNLTSVSGAPYLLGADGIVIVPEHTWRDDSPVKDDAAKAAVLPLLPALDRIVGAGFATCALARSGEVWCWTEPTLGFNQEVEAVVTPRPKMVPGQRDVAALTLSKWLTLCTLSKSGVVMCTSGSTGVTQLCELHGSRDVRCGRGRRQLAMPLPLDGAGYDPRTVLERPLAPVPGLDGSDPATSLHAWSGSRQGMLESHRHMDVYGGDEGGCALLASGGVRCWERDVCRGGRPWRSTDVQGLPTDVTRIELGAWDGYALTRSGALYTWRRYETGGPPVEQECPAAFVLRASLAPLDEPIVDVGGCEARVARTPSVVGVDCAISSKATVTCWATEDGRKSRLTVTRYIGDGGSPNQ